MRNFLLVLCASLVFVGCGDEEETNNANNGDSVEARVARIAALTPNAANGAAVYKSATCETCHGAGGAGVPNLGNALTTSTYTKDQTIEIIIVGAPDASPSMTALGGLADQDIADVTAHSLAFQN